MVRTLSCTCFADFPPITSWHSERTGAVLLAMFLWNALTTSFVSLSDHSFFLVGYSRVNLSYDALYKYFFLPQMNF